MRPTLLFVQKATGATAANASKFYDALCVAMDRFEINTKERMAAFLATVAIESAHLTAVEEGLSYSSADRLAKIFKRAFPNTAAAQSFVKNPKGLSLKVYEGYHGRGLIQLTWKANYKAASDALGVDFVKSPELLCTPQYAALSAAWFWKKSGCNTLADAGDMKAITRQVNGPAMLDLEGRQEHFAAAMSIASFC